VSMCNERMSAASGTVKYKITAAPAADPGWSAVDPSGRAKTPAAHAGDVKWMAVYVKVVAGLDRVDFLRARFDAGLAWVHYPPGLGGLDLPSAWQEHVDGRLAAAGAPDNEPHKNIIGLGMAAPTLLAFGTPSQKTRFLRPLWTGEELWCQLFSEPGAGSDLANVATRATQVEDASWLVEGQKVWTSGAHRARWGILLSRTDPDKPKHAGLTYFLCDMTGRRSPSATAEHRRGRVQRGLPHWRRNSGC
jgi:alkylation response protein AidB-like acyl-CoA dehydrogenase